MPAELAAVQHLLAATALVCTPSEAGDVRCLWGLFGLGLDSCPKEVLYPK